MNGRQEFRVPGEGGIVRAGEDVAHGFTVAVYQFGVFRGHGGRRSPHEDPAGLIHRHGYALESGRSGYGLRLEVPARAPQPQAGKRAPAVERQAVFFDALQAAQDIGCHLEPVHVWRSRSADSRPIGD